MTIEEIIKKTKYEILNFNINKTVVITMLFTFAIIGIIKLQINIDEHDIKPAYINYTKEELEIIENELQEVLDKNNIQVIGLYATEDELGRLGYGFKHLGNRSGSERTEITQIKDDLMEILEKYQK